jgi:hypothetical protein
MGLTSLVPHWVVDECLYPMKKQCLPCYLIIRNVCLVLVAIASAVVLAADIHASANPQTPQAIAIRRLFAYQLMINSEQE